MSPMIRNIVAIAIFAFAVALGFQRYETQPALTPAPSTGEIVWSHGPNGSSANAEEHWEKHGREFPEYHSAQEYERGALAFVTAPPPGTLTKIDERGDTLLYNPATNTFAVKDRRGEPRTFFRPDNGMAYWNRK